MGTSSFPRQQSQAGIPIMMAMARALLVLAGVAGEVYFEETFDSGMDKWVEGAPPGKEAGKWAVTPGKWFVDEKVNQGLATTEDMRFHSISAKMDKPSTSKGKPIVLQFSAKYEAHQYAFCGGGYIKLLPDGLKQATFCGYDVSHIHLIFNHKGTNLLKTEKISLEYSDKNEYTHMYTAVIQPDGTYEVFFDMESKVKGSLVDGWDFPKPTIDDPEDKKPEGYDDIPSQIPDPDATKPDDWDDEDD